ncbi:MULTISPECIES: response regulator [Fusobacterium]|jgi:two-component system response regulator DctR|uniref:DNA-binding response regulator n=1 Tax=Fusobacterium varium ATCC 27725 TaxID=469618 RepID=A0ABN5JDW0_FUSVA|nr:MULTISPECIES: response regulator [Fusobacterium]AVQ29993.1 DNA-binding response regulator [Fusobacterium varium ATCC 27725]EES64984.1 response regulator receiver domain protein [Fusobacterium varium ATCC 27725]MCF0170729.1 response regulator [Fusobacterium varium]MCF2673149.1 response regulator [Fusobacterium varium]MCI6032612.1 response regulator [Fusobacterium varium]
MKNKILIIDDSKDIIFAISEFFLMKDWEVYTALSVEEALKIVSTKELNIIIIDYHMPYINGVLGVKLIRQMNENVPIIALTIEGVENIAEEFFLAGADDFAIKPIKVLDLYSRVNVHLNKKKVKNLSFETSTTKKEKYGDYKKGISVNTISLIENKMKQIDSYITIEEISEATGLASQTVNKYMNYLVEMKMVDLKIIYGKIGRPRNEYYWKK